MSFKISESDEFNEFSFYSLSHPNKEYFIHQHVVDAYQSQMADKETKSIAIVFFFVRIVSFSGGRLFRKRSAINAYENCKMQTKLMAQNYIAR